jgi:hypothetical protein
MGQTRYRCRLSAIVRTQPSAYAPELARVKRGSVFNGFPSHDRAWVVRTIGGYVERSRLVVVEPREEPMSQQPTTGMPQEQYLAAVDRFSAAIMAVARRVPKAERDELRDATGDLLNAVAERATAQSLAGFSILLSKLEALEETVEHMQAAAEQAQEVGG